ncbi:T9SS type A sorting domain-containing protein [Avrilella dinanensis]|uniref:T9SS type A sorting domain-containing protein n=1 Tax=Avrilella dinanensis TaxID=2008672 RepID=UPI002409A14F|nr:T9SS type A sorting domain-containing protein [Avrilella dinanensis]
MKTIILIIGLVLGLNSYAQTQEEQLKAHNWYVYKVVIDEQEYFTPVNEELTGLGANFGYSDGGDIWINACWSSGLEETVFISDEQFTSATWVSLPLINCVQEENIFFSQQYDDVLLYQEENLLFNYEINELDNNVKELVVTNEFGNQAYFYSTYLSSESYIFEEAKIYPNPAQTVINVELPASEYQNVIFDLYDISGKKLKAFTKSWSENIQLNISDLPAGNYLLEFNLPENTGRGCVVKLIKE